MPVGFVFDDWFRFRLLAPLGGKRQTTCVKQHGNEHQQSEERHLFG